MQNTLSFCFAGAAVDLAICERMREHDCELPTIENDLIGFFYLFVWLIRIKSDGLIRQITTSTTGLMFFK